MTPTLTVLAASPSTSIQDRGRAGLARLGISPSGAADRSALARANRLVGNPIAAAAIEVTLGGLALESDEACLIALAGADPDARIGGRPMAVDSSAVLQAGTVLRLGRPIHGVRTYVAVRGGIAVAPVLGSRSSDSLSGLGPAPLRAGVRLPVGTSPDPVPDVEVAPPPRDPIGPGGPAGAGVRTLRCRPGPRADWFTEDAHQLLLGRPWRVSTDIDRVGVRLSGPTLGRVELGELPSEGIVRGAVQVPADGQPLIFLADHPTTGGYPVIAVIEPADVDLVAQLRPGEDVGLVSAISGSWSATRR